MCLLDSQTVGRPPWATPESKWPNPGACQQRVFLRLSDPPFGVIWLGSLLNTILICYLQTFLCSENLNGPLDSSRSDSSKFSWCLLQAGNSAGHATCLGLTLSAQSIFHFVESTVLSYNTHNFKIVYENCKLVLVIEGTSWLIHSLKIKVARNTYLSASTYSYFQASKHWFASLMKRSILMVVLIVSRVRI